VGRIAAGRDARGGRLMATLMFAARPVSEWPFRRVAWLLPVAFAIHEAEEWNILAWYQRYWTNVGALTQRSSWTWLVFASALGCVATWLLTRLPWERVVAHLLLALFVFPVSHALLHLYFLWFFAAWNPGLLTAVTLLLPAGYLVAREALRRRLVSRWYLGALVLLGIPPIVGAARLAGRVPDTGLPWFNLGAALAEALFGAP